MFCRVRTWPQNDVTKFIKYWELEVRYISLLLCFWFLRKAWLCGYLLTLLFITLISTGSAWQSLLPLDRYCVPSRYTLKIFSNEATDKGLISKIYKQLVQLDVNKYLNQKKMGRRPKQIFLQRRYTDGQQTHENILNLKIIREFKSRLQWGTTSHQS